MGEEHKEEHHNSEENVNDPEAVITAKIQDVDPKLQGQRYSNPARTKKVLVDETKYEAIKSNSVGENEMLLSNYQQALKK